MERILDNLQTIKSNVAAACASVGRNPDEVLIVAATKTRGIDVIDFLDSKSLVFGVGENKVQEFREKYHPLNNICWHFIGQLQTNKVKYIVGKTVLIHSVDRMELATCISERAKKVGVCQQVLVEVNMAGEQAKGGVSPDKIDELIQSISKLPNIEVVGMMSVLPALPEEELIPYYEKLKEMFEKRKTEKFKYLSAGMSGDYSLAVKYGANIIRPGVALFGERVYPVKQEA